MHPSQAGLFRKAIAVLVSAAFTGALMVYTGMANLDLLRATYPNPGFYMFGLLCLEGGIVYWEAQFFIHLSGIHKAMAAFMMVVDLLISCTGFVYETESVTHSMGTIQLPPVVAIVAFAVVVNVGMALNSHLIPAWGGSPTTVAGPAPVRIVESARPGAMKQLAAGAVAPLMERGQAYLQAREDSRKAAHQAAHKLVADYLEEHPDASIEEIRKLTKLSRQTIIDHRREILGQ